MLKPFLILSALVLSGAAALPSPQQAPSAAAPAPVAKIPLEAVNQVNPIKPDTESMTRAKKIYGYECAMCHGEDGAGAGDLSKNMKAKMGDFRDPATLKARTDGELFYIIKNGSGEMEGEGGRVKPDDTWGLVNYLRSLSHGQRTVAAQGPA
jgi:mono/diheme cytochrome c family protein